MDPPAPWGLGYNGTKQNGDWGAICHEWWLLGVPFGPCWSSGRQAVCCVSLVLGTLPLCSMTNANLFFRPLSEVGSILAISSNAAWKENDPKKREGNVMVTSTASGLGEAKTVGKALVVGLAQG